MQPQRGELVEDLLAASNQLALVDADADGDLRLTYEELRELVEELAGGLHHLGVQLGDGVAVMLEHGVESVLMFLAICRAAAVAMPINPQLREAEIAALFEGKRPALVVLGPDGHAAAATVTAEHGISLRTLEPERRLGIAAPLVGAAQALPDPDAGALILHTSGTTSRPRVVPLRQRDLAAFARAIASPVDHFLDPSCVTADELRAHCATRMASFKAPRTIHLVNEILKSATGKVQRRTLTTSLG